MIGSRKAFSSLIDVTKIRIAREEKALSQLLVELREVRDEFEQCKQEEVEWKMRKAEWEREISGAGSLLGLSERAKASIGQKIDTIDLKLGRLIQRRRLLEADVKTIQEQCRLQRKMILKQSDLKKIFQTRIEKLARHQRQIAEEERESP